MIDRLLKFLKSETFRYLFFGALTVLVNVVAYWLLSLVCGAIAANTIAFFAAVLFAYWTNSTFVFCVPHTWKNFLEFMGMRISNLVIDDGGLYLLMQRGVNDLLAKCILNAIIIGINYLCSKFFIFRKK